MADKVNTLSGAEFPGFWMIRTDPSVAPKPDSHSCYAMIDSKSIQPEVTSEESMIGNLEMRIGSISLVREPSGLM
ncbi:MAG: hypothetical protein OEY25_00130 [Candidatus Aminicenantes bacterium]|nr:hypothetical protein [Candidatus Aminicenantes bacterium]